MTYDGNRFNALHLLVGIFALCWSEEVAVAADKLWDNVNGGVFTLDSNWFGGVPGPNDVARFETTNSNLFQRTYTVSFANDPTNQQLVVEDDNVTFNLIGSPSNHTYTLSNEFVAVALGTVADRSGNLTVRNGALAVQHLGSDLEIAPVANASGVLTVGAGGGFLGAPDVLVGLNGNGQLNINSGGGMIANVMTIGVNSDSTGTATITGPGSSLFLVDLMVGWDGSGTLSITDGGRVESASSVLGQINGKGTVTVDGNGSTWVVGGTLTTGRFGQGAINITGGGQVIANEVTIGLAPVGPLSTATINGSGSSLVVTALRVGTAPSGIGGGLGAQGTLDVTAGGKVESTSGIIGQKRFDRGVVTVDGPGSRWMNSGALTVGVEGNGFLNITGGGRVSNSTAIISALNTDPFFRGRVLVAGAGSTWDVNGRLGVGGDPASGSLGGNGSLIIQSGGTVNVAQDTLVYSDDLLWLDGGTLSTTEISFPTSELSITPGTFDWRSGTLHVGVFHGNLTVPSGGVLAPGNSLGSTVVFGDYEETPGAKLQIEIGGSPTSFQFDKLEVRGNVVLGGNLEISLLNGFVPTAANGYAILTPFSISGEFENVAAGERLMTSDALGSFIVNYGPGSPFNPTFVVLSDFRPLFPGDYNFDGLVDGADFLAWQRGGSPNPNSAADLALWSTNFGAGSSSALSTAAPEPRSIVGGVLALWATASWPRRRGSFLFATLRLGDSRDGGGRFDGSLW